VAEPFLSEIRIMGFGYPPKGWALCNGQLMPINQNQALFSLLGTTYGGNGQTNFALPNLQGRAPIHVGSGHNLGEQGGEQSHTLTAAELPQHQHTLGASQANADGAAPANAMFGTSNNMYAAATNQTTVNPGTITNTGGSQAHLNMQPFLTLSFCIALQGIFPSRN
jgi:microcystin-dependent protein